MNVTVSQCPFAEQELTRAQKSQKTRRRKKYVVINMHVDGLALDTWVHTKFHNYIACELWPIVGLLQHKKSRERGRERERRHQVVLRHQKVL